MDTFSWSQFLKFMVQGGGIACGKVLLHGGGISILDCLSWIRQTLIEPGRKSISNCDREGPSKKVECNQWEIEGRGIGWVELNHGEIWYCKGP